jgi:hypothetical protein
LLQKVRSHVVLAAVANRGLGEVLDQAVVQWQVGILN